MTDSIGKLLKHSPKILSKVSDTPRLDIELLLSKVLKVSREYLHAWDDYLLTDKQCLDFHVLLQKRKDGKPIAYILGKQAFWSLILKVTPATLIPRPETELLVDVILRKFTSTKNLSVLDLGTGSGAIALALAIEQPTWKITALDFSVNSLKIAQENAKNYNIVSVNFIHSNWYGNLKNRNYDIIVSNPPYIAKSDLSLNKYVLQYEPKTAFISDHFGLADITKIVHGSKYFLKKNGLIILEHGYQQNDKVKNILREHSYMNIESHSDLSGVIRAVSGSGLC